MDRKLITFGKAKELEISDKKYWSKTNVEEKLKTITYLRECFYGTEATSGRLQRIYKVFNRRRNLIQVEEIEISTIAKEDLIKNKRASGRHRDLADIESFEGEQDQ